MADVVLEAVPWVGSRAAADGEQHGILYIRSVTVGGVKLTSDGVPEWRGRVRMVFDGGSDFLTVEVDDPPQELVDLYRERANYLDGTNDRTLILAVTSLRVEEV